MQVTRYSCQINARLKLKLNADYYYCTPNNLPCVGGFCCRVADSCSGCCRVTSGRQRNGVGQRGGRQRRAWFRVKGVNDVILVREAATSVSGRVGVAEIS